MASGGGNGGRKNGGNGNNQNSKQIPFRNWNSDPIIDNDDDDDFMDEIAGENYTSHYFNKYQKGKDKHLNKSITSTKNTEKHMPIKEKRLS